LVASYDTFPKHMIGIEKVRIKEQTECILLTYL
jgi:hypothetical protein